MTATGTRSPYNHLGCQGCNGTLPLTLADRELIHGRALRQSDDDGRTFYCADCLADLPPDEAGAMAHVCGQHDAEPGDLVHYHGSITEYHGRYEVTRAGDRRIDLFDVDRAVRNVRPGSVTILRRNKGKAEPVMIQLYDAGVGDVINLDTHHPAEVIVTGYQWAEVYRGDYTRLAWQGTGRWASWRGMTLLSDKTRAALVSKAGPDNPLRKQYEADIEAQLAALADTIETEG